VTSPGDPPLRAELRAGLLVGLGCAVAGVVLGVVWRLVVPLAEMEKTATGVLPVGGAETEVAADGWFAVCAALAGVLAAVAAALLLRSGRLGALVGLVAGGLVGALVAWRVGLLLSPPEIAAAAKEVRVGDTLEGPLRMSAYGVLLAWPTAAVITFFAVVAGLDVESHGTDRAEPLPERAERADHAGLTATDPVTGVTATDPGAAEPSRLSPGVPPEPPAPR
jgi:hypothetical protein